MGKKIVMYVVNIGKWYTLTDAPRKIENAGVQIHGDSLYVIGGYGKYEPDEIHDPLKRHDILQLRTAFDDRMALYGMGLAGPGRCSGKSSKYEKIFHLRSLFKKDLKRLGPLFLITDQTLEYSFDSLKLMSFFS